MNAILAVFVAGTIITLASALTRRRYRNWRKHRDERSRRELVMSVALLLLATTGATSALFSIAQIGPVEVRRTLGAVAWSSLLTYLVVALQETKARDEDGE